MKKVIPLTILFSFLFFSCKTTKDIQAEKSVSNVPVETVKTDATVVKEQPKEEVVAKPVKSDKPVLERTEAVQVAQNEDKSLGQYEFYVIAGSFSNQGNAGRFKNMMKDKGFTPVVLTSESGLYRVSVEQTNSEYDARIFIGKMRGIYPEHSDIWLLRRK